MIVDLFLTQHTSAKQIKLTQKYLCSAGYLSDTLLSAVFMVINKTVVDIAHKLPTIATASEVLCHRVPAGGAGCS